MTKNMSSTHLSVRVIVAHVELQLDYLLRRLRVSPHSMTPVWHVLCCTWRAGVLTHGLSSVLSNLQEDLCTSCKGC